MGDHYHVLGLRRNATEEEIRKAYHTLALKFHPDKSVRNASERMARINEAYSILSDPGKRAAYDQSAPLPRSVVLYKLSQNFYSMCHWVSGSLERYNNDNGSPYGKIIVGLLIGGGLLIGVVYIKYRRGQVIIPPPPFQQVLDVVIPTASIKAETSGINPTPLWTLAALLAALKSRNVFRLAMSTASSIAKTIAQGSQSGLSSAAKTIAQGSQSGLSSAAKTIAQGSQSGLSSAVKTVSSGTQAILSGPSVNSAGIVLATEKATAGGFKLWTLAAGLLGKASSLRFPLSPVLAFRARRLRNSVASGVTSAATKIGSATIKGASKARTQFRISSAVKTIAQGSQSGLSSAAKIIAQGSQSDWYSGWNSVVNRITKVVKEKKVPFKPLSSRNIIYVPPSPLKSFDPKLAPKSRGYKRAIKYVIVASAIGSLTYVFLR